ncbi:MAG: hypothetical protein IJD91_06255 [Clostridia bacterium]|nr:hypothetical protein [Clostridia bacterium]
MTEAERIEFIIKVLESGNAAEFAKRIGVSKATAVRMRTGTVGIRLRINDILSAYPAINRTWLETGEGYPGDLTVDLVKSHYEQKLKRNEVIIDHLTRRIDELERRNEEVK